MKSKWFCKSCIDKHGVEVEILTIANVFNSLCVECGEKADYLVANSESLLTQRTPDGGDSAPSQALSTPDMFSAIEHEPTPAPRR